MINILIIGTGGIGARHLQSAVQTRQQANIQALDISLESLQKAKDIVGDNISDTVQEVEYIQDINQVHKFIDVCIVATGAAVRRQVIEKLLNIAAVKYLMLEKVLFQSIKDYHDMSTLFEERNIKAYVNFPRRCYETVDNIKAHFNPNEYIEFNAYGGNWNLASNALHYIDMFSYISDCTDGFVINTTMLDDKIQAATRASYMECTGAISGATNKYTYSVTSYDGELSPVTITMFSKSTRIVLLENENKYLYAHKDNGFVYEERPYKMLYQSQLTAGLIDDLVINDNCKLTPFAQACKLHIPFIDALTKVINKQMKVDNDICPIT